MGRAGCLQERNSALIINKYIRFLREVIHLDLSVKSW